MENAGRKQNALCSLLRTVIVLLEDETLATFWKKYIANPVFVPRARYILANIFENIASIVSRLDSRNIFIGEFKKNYFAEF